MVRKLETRRKASLEDLAQDFSHSFRYENDSLALYHLTEDLRIALDDNSLSVKKVLRSIPQKRQNIFHISLPNSATYDLFLQVRGHLSTVEEEELPYYGQAAGTYWLAGALLAEARVDDSPNLRHVYSLVKNRKTLQDLIGEKRTRLITQWKPKEIGLNFADAELAISILRREYEKSPNRFFDNYGSPLGALNLARELKEIEERGFSVNSDVKVIHQLVGSPDIVSSILDVKDDRFETSWRPRTILLDVDKIHLILDHLKGRYAQNPDAFFEIYGSVIGDIILSKELEGKHGVRVSPQRLGTLTNDGRTLQELLEVEDLRFKRSWNPHHIHLTNDNIDVVVDFLREKYTEDSDKFFDRYSAETGVLNIARDLSSERDIALSPDKIGSLTANGDSVSRILNIKDHRFSKWYQRKIARYSSLTDSTRDLLIESYSANAESFFSQYGSSIGLYNLAKDLRSSRRFTKRINLHALSTFVGNPTTVTAITGLSDQRFEKLWKPRNFNIYLDTLEDVLDFLRTEYDTSSQEFFDVYGGAIGTYVLGKKLKQRGINLHLTRLGTIVNKGRVLSELLERENSKFTSHWKPRSMYFSVSDLEKVISYLQRKYREDNNDFFNKYGAIEGQVTLTRDIEKELGKPISYLSGLVGSGTALEQFMEVSDERFSTLWNTNVIQTSYDKTEMVIDFLREGFEADPNSFFRNYGRISGVIDIARDLAQARGVNIQLDHLSSLSANGRKLEKILSVQDTRFETEWKPKRLKGKYSDVNTTLNLLAQRYAEDPNDFFTIYGSVNGIMELSAELESSTGRVARLSAISSIIDPKILYEQLNINDERLDTDFNPRRLLISNSQAKEIIEHLKSKYEESPNVFFERYGSRLGLIILAQELGKHHKQTDRTRYATYTSLIGNGAQLQEFLGLNDSRFEYLWHTKLNPEMESIAVDGLKQLAKRRNLPAKAIPVNEELRNYLIFRYNIIRGISKGADLANRTSKDTLTYFAHLFEPEHAQTINEFVSDSISKDREKLENLVKSRIPQIQEDEISFEEYGFIAGRLLYSFDHDIAMQASSLLINLGEQMPTYRSLIRHGGEYSDTAHELLLKAVVRYDPYLPLRREGHQKLLSLQNWVGSYLRYARLIVHSQKGRSKFISIETGGPQSNKLHEDTKRLPGF